MKLILVFLSVIFWSALNAQFHDDNVVKITSLVEAQQYAERNRGVSFGLVNSEMDVFLFDKVDTKNMQASVGTMTTIYRRRTKFLKDTVVTLVNIQVIEFDPLKISLDSANLVKNEILEKYNGGATYWSLLKEFRTEACKFDSGPSTTELLKKRFGSTLEDRKKDEIFESRYLKRPEYPILIIISQEAHEVPAFYAISYNVSH